MNRRLYCILLWILTGAVPAGRAADAVPAAASTNLPGAEFPRVAPDRSVMFRIKAPEAKMVKVEGGAGLLKSAMEMTKSPDGMWSVTTPPAVPGFHYYWFTVDGLRVNDAASRLFFGWGRDTSGIEIPETGTDFYDAKPEVPHGAVRMQWYHSRVTGQLRRVHVYTPPDYDRETQVRYPVLYLLHGAGENERGWLEQGRANFILDNLLASRWAGPMIVVMDTGYASFPNARGEDRSAATAAFEELMLKELIPLVDTNFRTKTTPEARAMAGLSMGGGQTLAIALRHPETFAWIGAMSAPPRQEAFEAATAYNGVFKDAAAFHAKVKLLWLGAGTAEERIHAGTLNMHQALDKAGITHVFYSSAGTDHEWQTWRRGLLDFAVRLFRE